MEKLHDIIEETKLKPVIINERSNFVIITYWWGRGNLNLNTQKPCRDELIEGQELSIQPIRFEKMIDKWIQYCKKANCNYLVQEYPEFAVPGGYQMAINAKPLFIKKALESVGERAVVYIDGDMSVNNYPSIFDMKNVDFMARGWNIDPRSNVHYLSKHRPICFDPFVFETSGGTMYFGNTENSRKLLDMWANTSSFKVFQGKADDRILSMIISSKKLYVKMNILQLPIEYLWLTDNYEPDNKKNQYLNKVHYDRNAVVFEHAACLTSEEKAVEQGAATNRQPKFYDKLLEDVLECQTEGGIFFEYIIFESYKQSLPWVKYLRYVSTAKLYKDDEGEIIHPYYVVPYKKVYGDNKNNIAIENVEKSRELISVFQEYNLQKDYVKITHGKTTHYSNGIIYTPHIIPGILALHYLKKFVIYLPSNFDINVLKRILNTKNDYELSVRIENGDDNYPIFDKKSPICLSYNSRVLHHILKITKNIDELNKNIRLCALFIQLIRCNFIMSSGNTVSKTKLSSTKHVRSLDRSFRSFRSFDSKQRSKELKKSFSKLFSSNKRTNMKSVESKLRFATK